MFKINVDPIVLATLQQAFPSSNAERSLRKYVSTLEAMLFASAQHDPSPMQIKLGLHSISLHQLTHRGGQIGPHRIRLHNWLQQNDLALIEIINKGSNLTRRLSQVRLTRFAQLCDELATTMDDEQEVNAHLGGSDSDNEALVDLIYKDFDGTWTQEKVLETFDIVDVDLRSVANYINWVASGNAKLYSAEKRTQALRQARTIFGVAQHLSGSFLQRKKPSDFGRLYYEGLSVQSVNKELRAAMLGNCWEYDIRSSVISWKMGFAQELAALHDKPVNDLFRTTLLYLEDKADFTRSVRHFVFNKELESDFTERIIKQALTAISFGARNRTHGWRKADGDWKNPALVDIIKNEDQRKRFLSDTLIRQFIQEQNLLDDYLYEGVKSDLPELLRKPVVQTNSGKPSKAKVIAYLYQHAEREVMNLVEGHAKQHGRKVLARVHDAIFLRQRLGVDLKDEIEHLMREATGNPYWRLAAKQIERFEPRGGAATADELAHRDRMAAEQRRAEAYIASGRTLASDMITLGSLASV